MLMLSITAISNTIVITRLENIIFRVCSNRCTFQIFVCVVSHAPIFHSTLLSHLPLLIFIHYNRMETILPDTGRAEEHGDSKERFIEDDDCFLKNANFDTYKASIWMEKHQIRLGNVDQAIADTASVLARTPHDLTDSEIKGKALFIRATRFYATGRLGRALIDILEALECPLSTTQRKEANELLDQMVQKRFVSNTPLYRSYRESDEPFALLAFGRHEVDNDIDEPFVCLCNAQQEPQGILLRECIVEPPVDGKVGDFVPPKESWSAGYIGAFTPKAFEKSWIAEELRTKRNKKSLRNNSKGNKQWAKITVLHCAEIPAGTEFPPEFWVEEAAPGHHILYPKPHQTRAMALETAYGQLGCAELAAIAVHQPHCIVVRAEGELPSIQGYDPVSHNYQRCVHLALTQLHGIEDSLCAGDYEHLLQIKHEAVANNFHLEPVYLQRLKDLLLSAIDVASAPDAMEMHDTLAALRKFPERGL